MAHGLARADVEAAAARIAGAVMRTPMLRSDRLDELAGCELFLKAENMQRCGAFKARGAINAVTQLDPDVRARGIITYSSGNHAQAVAYAAQRFGVAATIVMPVDAPAVKVAAVRARGATIESVGTTSLERRARAFELHDQTGAAIIEPFDHPHTICGQGTATLELCEQVADATGGGVLDALVVPVGGGGLIAGACLVTETVATKIYSAEPVGCDALAQSVAAGELVPVEPGPTLCDGLKPTRIGELNFAVIAPRIAGSFAVADDEVGRALALLATAAKTNVEPSGAAALAAVLRGTLPGQPKRVGVMLSGGNIAGSALADLVGRYSA